MKANGAFKLDNVMVGEFSANLFGSDPVLSGKYLIMGSGENAEVRIGPGMRNMWSKKTMELLEQLSESMETDIIADLFVADAAPVVVTEEDPTSDGVPEL